MDYFNPRARVGRDISFFDKRLNNAISIHAPAWGATAGKRVVSHPIGISIHAPAWGATSRDIYFDLDLIISIHAPAWGATCGQIDWLLFL